MPRAFNHVVKPLSLIDGAVREVVLAPPPPMIVLEFAFVPAAVFVPRQPKPVWGR